MLKKIALITGANRGIGLAVVKGLLNQEDTIVWMGAYHLIRAFVPDMIKQNYGRIVNVSSGWGAFADGMNGPFAYSISKVALNALTLNLSYELPANVKVNAMSPGWVKTRMGGENAPDTPEEGAQTIVWLANLPENGPSGQYFRDKEVAPW